jgi:phosphate starvation-inducible PhoH-like protein
MNDTVTVNNRGNSSLPEASVCITFHDHHLLPLLLGEQDKHLLRIEQQLGVSTFCRGNIVSVTGDEENVATAKQALEGLYRKLQRSEDISMGDVDAAIRMAKTPDTASKEVEPSLLDEDMVIKTKKKHIRPYSHNQKTYIKALYGHELVFGVGPAGTGKTYLAVAAAVSMLMNRQVERIILSRPAVEAGEKLGFLPGDMREKVDPYLQPLYDALHDMLPAEQVAKHMENKEIEIAPLAFMRGRTLSHAYIILDEAQNSTPVQMKMFLTRLGEGSRMVIAGDLTQTDLPREVKSGLRDSLEKLKHIKEIARVDFTSDDVVRHPLTAKIVKAYEAHHSAERWGDV